MLLLTRLNALETKYQQAQEPPLRIVLVDENGRWWERNEEIDPASIRTRHAALPLALPGNEVPTMRLRTRVARLGGRATVSTAGCAVCHAWSPRVSLRKGEEPRPERCSTCGRLVPIYLIRVYDLVQIDTVEPRFDVTSVNLGKDDVAHAKACEPAGPPAD